MPRLALWNKVIGEEGARALANVLKGDATLAELYLWDCYIGRESVGRSAQGKRDVGDEVERALAKALKDNPNLIAARDIDSLAQTCEGGLSID